MNRLFARIALITCYLIFPFTYFCLSQPNQPARPYFISSNNLFDTSEGSIDNFSIANFEVAWPKAKARITRRALEHGAQVALIRLNGNVSRGYNAQVSLFRADSSRMQTMQHDTGCAMVIFRDHGPSLAEYRYDILIHDVTYRNFRDGYFIRKKLDNCFGEHMLEINRASLILPFEGRSRYFRLIKGGARKDRRHTYVRFGGYTLQEIGDETLGRLLSEAHTEHLIAP